MKLLILLVPTLASAFSLAPLCRTGSTTLLRADASSSAEEEDDGLVLDGLDKKMNQFKTEYSFSESDYLAAARKRAEERKESVNSGASDEDWKKMAETKESQFGKVDDWDNSVKEAGNADSQILMFTDPPADGEGGEEGESGDKLLLF
ncbi:unnamed protein product [Cylindrotheca closterium]|uniref:Uncharacterized protein n=1 Tax=Cylindrotheca closterium TaxID=2856 RepID=A0AAD2JKI5_9STRA|nr:unnamed protein product [Cylindrotheca closterium]